MVFYLYQKMAVAKLLRAKFPGKGACLRCDIPWGVADDHTTKYDVGCGCFPLCEGCWRDLKSPANRMPYYMQLVDFWVSGATRDGRDVSEYELTRQKIRDAVNAEPNNDYGIRFVPAGQDF